MELAKKVELTELSYILSLTRRRFVKGGRDCISQLCSSGSCRSISGLGVNAGHDLNLENICKFCLIPNILEVSIGHALMAGPWKELSNTVKAYFDILLKLRQKRYYIRVNPSLIPPPIHKSCLILVNRLSYCRYAS